MEGAFRITRDTRRYLKLVGCRTITLLLLWSIDYTKSTHLALVGRTTSSRLGNLGHSLQLSSLNTLTAAVVFLSRTLVASSLFQSNLLSSLCSDQVNLILHVMDRKLLTCLYYCGWWGHFHFSLHAHAHISHLTPQLVCWGCVQSCDTTTRIFSRKAVAF